MVVVPVDVLPAHFVAEEVSRFPVRLDTSHFHHVCEKELQVVVQDSESLASSIDHFRNSEIHELLRFPGSNRSEPGGRPLLFLSFSLR